MDVSVALDATYSVGPELSGIGVYSRRLLFGLAAAHPDVPFYFHYRPHRLLASLREKLPPNVHRRLLRGAPRADLFHALNQRVDTPGRRTITTFHDLFVISSDYSTPEFRERFTAQARAAASRSDVIIAVSRFTAQQVETLLGIPQSRIVVVPHGTDLPAEVPTERERLVLSVGAIQKRKNTARLVRAFERTPPGWRLTLAGAPSGYGASDELAAVNASSRRADIEILGYVPDAELTSLYQRAAIFAFPSLDEGFGIPVLEAMAQGLAVLTSDRSALPEIATGAALLVNPEDKEAIAAGLNALATNPDLRQQLAAQGRARAAEYPWERAVRETWAAYAHLW